MCCFVGFLFDLLILFVVCLFDLGCLIFMMFLFGGMLFDFGWMCGWCDLDRLDHACLMHWFVLLLICWCVLLFSLLCLIVLACCFCVFLI